MKSYFTLILSILILLISCNYDNQIVTEYWENGNPKSVYIQESTQNYHLEYYENGQLKSEGGKLDKEKKGLWKSYHSNGKIAGEVFYIAGQLFGEAKYFHENGILKQEGSFEKGGKKSGLWKNYYDNGKLKSKGDYKLGQKIWNWEYFDEQTNLRQTEIIGEKGFITETKYIEGDTTYWEVAKQNGELKLRKIFIENKRIGFWEEYDEDGIVVFKANFLEDNKMRIFYERNILFAEGKYAEIKDSYFNHEMLNYILPFPFYFYSKDLMLIGDWKFFNKKGKEIALFHFGETPQTNNLLIEDFSFDGKNCTDETNSVKAGKGIIRYCKDNEVVILEINKGVIKKEKRRKRKLKK